MSQLKQRISSPLEAGASILDAQNLPTHLTNALEYTSRKLAKKALHITALVIRKEYQLPSSMRSPLASTPTSVAPTPAAPEFSGAGGPLSPSRIASSMNGLKSILRRGSATTSVTTLSLEVPHSPGSSSASPTFTSDSSSNLSSPRRWPSTPGSPAPMTPMTPYTPNSVVTTSTSTTSASYSSARSAAGANSFTFRLIPTTPLTPKAEKTLRLIVSKAERKFPTGIGWLPSTKSAQCCALNSELIRQSLLQNEVLFSSEGLTLLGVDRLYAFKSALAAYARTTLPASSLTSSLTESNSARIEDAVDELRRLVLANGRRPLDQTRLHNKFDWIGVSACALSDVERMYRRAYGGMECMGAFESRIPEESPEQTRVTRNSPVEGDRENTTTPTLKSQATRRNHPPVPKLSSPPPPRSKSPLVKAPPALKLQTSFNPAASAGSSSPQSAIRHLERAMSPKNGGVDLPVKIEARPMPTGEVPRRPPRPAEEIMIRLDDLAMDLGEGEHNEANIGLQYMDVEDDGELSEHTELEMTEDEMDEEEEEEEREVETMQLQRPQPQRPQPRRPQLEIQQPNYGYDNSNKHTSSQAPNDGIQRLPLYSHHDEDGYNGGDVTARPVPGMSFWNGLGASIDEMMAVEQEEQVARQHYQREKSSPTKSPAKSGRKPRSPAAAAAAGGGMMTLAIPQQHRESRFARQSRMNGASSGIQRLDPDTARLGPITPNGYDDISPVTRGEWGFFLKGDAWNNTKTAAVETC